MTTGNTFVLPLGETSEVLDIPEGYEAELFASVPFAISSGVATSSYRCTYCTDGFVHKEQAGRVGIRAMRSHRPGTVKVTVRKIRFHPPRRSEDTTTTKETAVMMMMTHPAAHQAKAEV